EGQSTRGEFSLNLGICVYGVKLKFGGSALLPLNAALCLLVFQWLKASSVYVLCPFGSWSELSQQICIIGSIS
ncbi:hypothetical protein, partial [Vibrio parahaemolyticus]|uniref:hypothetical protein n=1 Tax=Vibrio parahaemolyticus TaxID=670 RepID=UPI001C9D1CE1